MSSIEPEMREEITVERGGTLLAGSIWLPTDPVAAVLMHPGSGSSNRDNDGYFTALRSHFLHNRIAVASFDKRGVGGSTGDWLEAGIETQAGDLVACAENVRRHPALTGATFGIFGHSQGGWVVVEAAGSDFEIGFVVVNSGPGVSVMLQDRYAHRRELEAASVGADEIEERLALFDQVVELASLDVAYEEVAARADLAPYLSSNAAHWRFWKEIFRYDPVDAMGRIKAPLLAVFGEKDVLVPVPESVALFRAHVDAGLLQIEVFPDADHRLQIDDLRNLAPGYLDRVTGFVSAFATYPKMTLAT
jgi:pimeloyl-ACP methyl ester carboxylesterase